MANYCTVNDVKRIAKPFSHLYDHDDGSLNADLEDAISEATEKVKEILKTRFDLTAIEASVPTVVKYFTALKAADIIFSRAL